MPPGQDHIAASNILVGAGTVGVTAMHRATTYTTVVDARVRARLTLGVTLPADARIRTVQLNGADVRPVVRLTHRGREVLVPAATGTAQRPVVRTG